MSLKPKRVNFEETWLDLKQTVKDVITMGNVNKPVWNDRFLYVFLLLYSYFKFNDSPLCGRQ